MTEIKLVHVNESSKSKVITYYDIVNKVATIESQDEMGEHTEISTDVFINDITRVIKLAKKHQETIQSKIDNNKIVIAMSVGNELSKATNHLAKNQFIMDSLSKFIEDNSN